MKLRYYYHTVTKRSDCFGTDYLNCKNLIKNSTIQLSDMSSPERIYEKRRTYPWVSGSLPSAVSVSGKRWGYRGRNPARFWSYQISSLKTLESISRVLVTFARIHSVVEPLERSKIRSRTLRVRETESHVRAYDFFTSPATTLIFFQFTPKNPFFFACGEHRKHDFSNEFQFTYTKFEFTPSEISVYLLKF